MISYRGLEPPDWVLGGLESGSISSVCLFSYNVESPAQLRETTRLLRTAARRGNRPPPLLGIDQEGGQLMAVTGGATELPGNMALGATRSTALAEQAGRLLGRELLAMGCNVDFAPVLDLAGHLSSNVVGTRAFGDDPTLVAELGAAVVRGLQGTGVLATAKHFPGHGDTALDSHHATPQVDRSRAQLHNTELVPFKAAIASGLKAIMSAHVRYPPLDDLPATLSQSILTGLLREELGFEGLAITDAMDMKAVAGPPALRARQAIDAGADLVLLGHLPGQQELLAELGPHFRSESLRRIEAARALLAEDLPELSTVGCQEHRELAQQIADRAVTAIPGRGRLPLELLPDEELGVITVTAGDLTPADTSSNVELLLARQLRERHFRLRHLTLPYGATAAQADAAAAALSGCAKTIVATVNAVDDPGQRRLLEAVAHSASELVHLVLRSPADNSLTPPGSICLFTYGIREANTEAAVRALFGEIEAVGRLPVSIFGVGAAGPAD